MKHKLSLCMLFSFVPLFLYARMTMSHKETHQQSIQAIVLAAGKGARLKTGISKLIMPLCGKEMIRYPVELLETLHIPTTIVVGFQKDDVIKAVTHVTNKPKFVVQEEQLGTGHALLCSQPTWTESNILLLNGDMPLISEDIILNLIDHHTKTNAKISLVVAHNTDTSIGYGRIVTKDGITRIVEAKHFTDEPEDYPLVNAGIYLIDRTFLEAAIDQIPQNEVTQEFYVTDLLELASKKHESFAIVEEPFDTLHGVNTFEQLEKAERILKRRLTKYWMANGVRFENPKTVHIDNDVTIGARTVIGSGVELRGNTHIGSNCAIKSYSILENAQINDDSVVEAYSKVSK